MLAEKIKMFEQLPAQAKEKPTKKERRRRELEQIRRRVELFAPYAEQFFKAVRAKDSEALLALARSKGYTTQNVSIGFEILGSSTERVFITKDNPVRIDNRTLYLGERYDFLDLAHDVLVILIGGKQLLVGESAYVSYETARIVWGTSRFSPRAIQRWLLGLFDSSYDTIADTHVLDRCFIELQRDPTEVLEGIEATF